MTSVYQEILEINEELASEGFVEKAILTPIRRAWNEHNAEVWEYFFSEHRMGKRSKPSNKEFISRISGYYYRTKVNFYAENDTGAGEYVMYTSSV